ncbi:Sulfur carrier protein TusA [subsurface metagenome]
MEEEQDVLKPDGHLDCTGLYCPAGKKINSMKEGQILELVADDPASEEDIKSWAKTTGNKLIKMTKNNDNFIFYIKKMYK